LSRHAKGSFRQSVASFRFQFSHLGHHSHGALAHEILRLLLPHLRLLLARLRHLLARLRLLDCYAAHSYGTRWRAIQATGYLKPLSWHRRAHRLRGTAS